MLVCLGQRQACQATDLGGSLAFLNSPTASSETGRPVESKVEQIEQGHGPVNHMLGRGFFYR